ASQPLYLAGGDIEGLIGGRLGRLAERQRSAYGDFAGGPVHEFVTSLLADAADPRGSLGASADDRALVFDVLVDRRPAELAADARGAIAAERNLWKTVHVAVDPDGSCLGCPRIAERSVDVAAPDPSAEAVS